MDMPTQQQPNLDPPMRTFSHSMAASEWQARGPLLGREVTGKWKHELTCTFMFVTLKFMNCRILMGLLFPPEALRRAVLDMKPFGPQPFHDQRKTRYDRLCSTDGVGRFLMICCTRGVDGWHYGALQSEELVETCLSNARRL